MYISTQSMIRNTLNYIAKNNEEKDLHQRRIVTGQRIFSPLDDPAGDSISRRMRYDLMAIDQATRNTQNNHSMLKVAHGAMESTKSLLTSIKEKAIYAANDSISDKDRQIVQKEVNEFIAQIDYNTGTTYNGKFLIDGSHRRPTDGTIQALTNQQLSELTTTVTMLIELQESTILIELIFRMSKMPRHIVQVILLEILPCKMSLTEPTVLMARFLIKLIQLLS